MKYKLRTIKDIYEKVPVDRVNVCLSELAELISMAKSLEGSLSIAADAMGIGATAVSVGFPDEIEWVDDGKGEISGDIQHDGKTIATISTQMPKEGES